LDYIFFNRKEVIGLLDYTGEVSVGREDAVSWKWTSGRR